MRRPWQYTLLGAAVAFFILYGIELSSGGIQDAYGPPEPGRNRIAGAGGSDGYGYPGDPYAYDGLGGTAPRTNPGGMRTEDAHGDAFAQGGDSGSGGAAPDKSGYDDYAYGYGPGGDRGGTAGRIADGAAGLLQSAAKGGIRFIVSLFESVMD